VKKKSLHILIVPVVSILSIVLMSFVFLNALNESISRQDEIVFSEPEINSITGRAITSTTTSKCLKPNPMNYNWLPSQYQPYSCDYTHEYSDGMTFQQCCSQGPNCWCANNDMAATYTDPNCGGSNPCILRYYCKTPQNKHPCNGPDPTAASQISCTDSDAADNPTVKGTASGNTANGPTAITDYCMNRNTVSEAYCHPTYGPSGKDIPCSSGSICDNGVCIGLDLQPVSVTLYDWQQPSKTLSANNIPENTQIGIILNYNFIGKPSSSIDPPVSIGINGDVDQAPQGSGGSFTYRAGDATTHSFSLPSSQGIPKPGQHTLFIVLDPVNTIPESNENNNVLQVPFTVVAPQQAPSSSVPTTQGQTPSAPGCGNGFCERTELSSGSCPQDCTMIPPPKPGDHCCIDLNTYAVQISQVCPQGFTTIGTSDPYYSINCLVFTQAQLQQIIQQTPQTTSTTSTQPTGTAPTPVQTSSGVAPTSPTYTAPSVSYTQPRSSSPRYTSPTKTSSMPSVSTPPIATLPAQQQLPGRLEPCETTIGCSSSLKCKTIKGQKGVCLDKVTEESFKKFMKNFDITIDLI